MRPAAIHWTRPATRDLRALTRRDAASVRDAVRLFARTGRAQVRRLTPAGGDLRLRSGPWTIRFRWHPEARVLIVVRVLSDRA